MPKNVGKSVCALVAAIALSPCLAADAFAQASPTFRGGPTDPGLRGGPPGAGCFLPGLNNTAAAPEQQFFFAAAGRFGELDSVSGTLPDAGSAIGLPATTPPTTPTGMITFCPGTPNQQTQPRQNGAGLGPDFNMNSCAGCHAQPAVGGTSPQTNPQIAVANLDGATNVVPSFIHANGPVREARFVRNPDGTPDGGVHDLFVITGRKDATGCTTTQPNFNQALAQNNVIFRIPTPVFGAGQIENTSDASLMDDSADVAGQQQANGIASGVFNRSGNDGTITKFGWKAQNKSLLVFAGEAYNVEQGVTNENFPNERDDTADCQFNQLPEDATNLVDPNTSKFPPSDYSSDIVNFAAFMRLLAGPTPVAATSSTSSTAQGEQAFNNVGCNLCHIRDSHDGKLDLHGAKQREVQPVQRRGAARHGSGTGGQRQPRERGWRPIPVRAAVGHRPAHLLPA